MRIYLEVLLVFDLIIITSTSDSECVSMCVTLKSRCSIPNVAGCSDVAQRVLRGCSEGAQRVLRGCSEGAQRLLRGCSEIAQRGLRHLLQRRAVDWVPLQSSSFADQQSSHSQVSTPGCNCQRSTSCRVTLRADTGSFMRSSTEQ